MRVEQGIIQLGASVIRTGCVLLALTLGMTGTADAQSQDSEPAGIIQAVGRYVAAMLGEPVSVDPRPIRPGVDAMRGLGPTDFVSDSAISASREREAHSAGLQVSNILVDRECVFTEGVETPPGTALTAEAVQRERECRARGPFTTYATNIAVSRGSSNTLGPVRVVAFTASGFHVWDLCLTMSPDGTWRVQRATSVSGAVS